jgi:hypothetical protein
MKKILIVLLLTAVQGHAQKPKHKRLIEQIAALQVYIGYAQQGYSIANKGLTTVRNIKNGDFNLHRDFISSFKKVNPKIKGYAKVADIIALQLRIILSIKECLKGVKEARQFSIAEIDHCSTVFQNVLNASLENIDQLFEIISDGELQMKDDERLKRIDALYTDMQDKYAFSSSFSEEMAVLTVQRMHQRADIELSKKLNGFQ